MMSIEMFGLWVLIMSGIGGYIAWRYSIEQYGEGMMDALTMHHTGRLTYEAVENDDGTIELEIKIKRYEQ